MAEIKAREEAERARQETAERLRKEDEEREARRRRVEAIMLRTRQAKQKKVNYTTIYLSCTTFGVLCSDFLNLFFLLWKYC